MNERFKQIRLLLKLSQSELGAALGVSRDVIANIEYGRSDLKENFILLLSSRFSVNSDWLRSGQGEMFLSPESISFDEYALRHGITSLERSIIEKFLMFDPEIRTAVLEMFSTIFSGISVKDDRDDIEEKVEQYRQELLLEKKKKEKSSPSRTSEGA